MVNLITDTYTNTQASGKFKINGMRFTVEVSYVQMSKNCVLNCLGHFLNKYNIMELCTKYLEMNLIFV